MNKSVSPVTPTPDPVISSPEPDMPVPKKKRPCNEKQLEALKRGREQAMLRFDELRKKRAEMPEEEVVAKPPPIVRQPDGVRKPRVVPQRVTDVVKNEIAELRGLITQQQQQKPVEKEVIKEVPVVKEVVREVVKERVLTGSDLLDRVFFNR